ncbi:hypothetical protein V2A60_000072 [Cordyceps javanica]|uniref:Tetratricopeptide repeat domain-containing protein n=1 Tax=Cordyceps javanica TaxID=43265 RepID=A0A545W3N1_9HYPO|nr:hypothetical protein IF1G_04544 [Cordyceps javanica]TQW08546.1 anaphase-promoting complex, cyclosome, subunit 3 domain-containing protein [Cordyceps javanica]
MEDVEMSQASPPDRDGESRDDQTVVQDELKRNLERLITMMLEEQGNSTQKKVEIECLEGIATKVLRMNIDDNTMKAQANILLALCHETQGKWATAWHEYNAAKDKSLDCWPSELEGRRQYCKCILKQKNQGF